MKPLLIAFPILLIAVAAPAQHTSPKPTMWKQFRIGETTEEFKAAAKPWYEFCERRAASGDLNKDPIEQTFCHDLEDPDNPANGGITVPKAFQDYAYATLLFDKGRFAKLWVPIYGMTFEETVGSLTKKYGPPSSKKAEPMFNSFGARWNNVNVFWNMPHRVLIQARQNNCPSCDDRGTTVIYWSSFLLRDIKPKQQNPF